MIQTGTRRATGLASIALLLTACAGPGSEPQPAAPAPMPAPTAPAPAPAPAPRPPAPAPAPAPAPPPPPVAVKSPAEQRLAEGVALYDAGDYRGAIRKLQGSQEIWAKDTPAAVAIEAHKTLAFSLCVTGQRAACRRQFDALLKLDPAYELKPSEAGHPQWGPVFVQAKRAANAPARPAAKPPAKPATPATPAPKPAAR